MSADYNMSSKGNEDVEFAYVRVGVYEAVDNHSVTITRMWIEGRNSSIELPVLGNNIVAVEAISDNADAPTFDTENGDWTKLVPSGSSTDIMVHFDALVTCENGGSYTIPVNDARIKIKAQRRSGQIHGRFRSGSGVGKTEMVKSNARGIEIHQTLFLDFYGIGNIFGKF